jgi:hypothetical protein
MRACAPILWAEECRDTQRVQQFDQGLHERKLWARSAAWTEEWRETKGLQFYLIAAQWIVQVPSWHQVHTDQEAANALRHVKAAGSITEHGVRNSQSGG